MRKPNVLFLTTHLNPGGITSYIYNLTKALIKKGYKIVIISSGGLMYDYLSKVGAKVINFDIKTKSELSPKIWFNLGRIFKIIRDEEIDIIHAHTRVTQVLAQVASRKLQKVYVSTCHGFFRANWFRKEFGCWGDKVIAISEPVKEHLIKDLNVAPEKVALVYNGIDLNRYTLTQELERQEAKKKLGIADKPTVGIIARLSDIKGHQYLIRAFKKVVEEGLDCQLLIVGEGNMKADLVGLIGELGISEKIYFKPAVLDTKEVLDALDIFCMPSLKEGLGLGVAEAQAVGVPVVVSRVGGLINLVSDAQTGLLVEPKDPLALAKAIRKLLEDKELFKNLSQNARKFVEEKFSLDRMVFEIEEIYRKAVEE